MKIWILDDIYGKIIYEGLSKILPDFEYPIKENIDSPIPYLWEIENGDVVCLDNWFPGEYREEPLGDDFLWQYLKLNYCCNIICLSTDGVNITKRFEQRCKADSRGDIIGYAPNKDPKEIIKIMKQYGLL